MAHNPLHNCLVARPGVTSAELQSIYGPFQQTQFLGLSVLSFTANAGVNEQSSELTVELVQDLCVTSKVSWNTSSVPFTKTTSIEADPGFTYPIVGAPCYFRVADFEYSGILQSWNKKEGPDGFPIYSVKLIDPRVILDNVQIILSDYQGAIKGLNADPTLTVIHPDYQLVNIINPYGFLDSIRQNCAFVDANGNEALDGYMASDGGPAVYFGSPAGGWGTSTGNTAGIPWNYLKRAVQCLIGSTTLDDDPPTDLQANRNRFAKGYISGPPGNKNTLPATHGYGEIYTGGSAAAREPAKYLLDLSEIPDAPPFYRVSGPLISASEMISQVCRDAGCDYFIELLPTGNYLVIKVRVIIRKNQPAMGEIEGFITTAGLTSGATTASLGEEYRPNPNNAFIIGDKKRSIYRHSGSHTYPTGTGQTIQPYWGRDLNGNLNPSYQSTCEITDTADANHWIGPPDWNVRLDFREVMGLLSHKPTTQLSPDQKPLYAWTKLDGYSRAWVWEGELRACLGTFKDFMNFLLRPNPYGTCQLPFSAEWKPNAQDPIAGPTGDSTFLRLWAEDIAFEYQGLPGLPAALRNAPGPGVLRRAGVQAFLTSISVKVSTTGPTGPGNTYIKDAQRMHQWLQRYAQEHYGRKWLVEVPFACFAGDTGNPNTLQWTDVPSAEGGWYDGDEVIELANTTSRSIAIERFKTDDGKIGPILRWTQNPPNAAPYCTVSPCVTGLDYDQVNMQDMVTNLFNTQITQGPDLYVWQKAEIADAWVTGSPYSGSNPSDSTRIFALLTCDPITSGFPVNDGKRSPDSFDVSSGLRDKIIHFGQNPMVGVGGAYGSRMISPKAAVVPVLSNTQTYGPWWKQNGSDNAIDSYGTVYAEQDTSLNPWEYGGSEYMNIGAISKLENATTQMNIAERGEVTIPGYPTKGVGAGITSDASLYDGAGGRSIYTSNFFGYPYSWASGVGLKASSSSASIANINVVVSPQGVTTSYTITTFTPVFGRFSKGNADRIKKIGRNRLDNERARKTAASRALTRHSTASAKAHTMLSKANAGPAMSPTSASVLLSGRTYSGDQRRKEVVIGTKNTFSFYEDYGNTAMMSIDGLLRPVAHTGARTPGIQWASGGGPLPAMKSYSDIFCPIGTGIIDYEITGVMGSMSGSGSGFLGAYSGFPSGIRYENQYTPASPPPPIPHFSGIIVAANYLDPLADIGSNPKFITGARASGNLGTGTGVGGALLSPYASGHDIESVARGDASGLNRMDASGSGWAVGDMTIGGESGRYTANTTDSFGLPSESGSGDYRFMALKGPLVLQSWGYDTYGKPIPNAKGHPDDPSYDTGLGGTTDLADSGNAHQRTQDGLTDRFAPNWLSDATNWPVAPVDLRYDRIRGVWTTPPPFRLMKSMAPRDILAQETGLVELLTGGDMFDENGRPFSGVVTIQPTGTGGPNDTGLSTGIAPFIAVRPDFDISSGSVLITYYDTYSCEHWVLGAGGSGGGGGVNGNVPTINDFVCEGDIISTTSTTLSFSAGILVSTG